PPGQGLGIELLIVEVEADLERLFELVELGPGGLGGRRAESAREEVFQRGWRRRRVLRLLRFLARFLVRVGLRRRAGDLAQPEAIEDEIGAAGQPLHRGRGFFLRALARATALVTTALVSAGLAVRLLPHRIRHDDQMPTTAHPVQQRLRTPSADRYSRRSQGPCCGRGLAVGPNGRAAA